MSSNQKCYQNLRKLTNIVLIIEVVLLVLALTCHIDFQLSFLVYYRDFNKYIYLIRFYVLVLSFLGLLIDQAILIYPYLLVKIFELSSFTVMEMLCIKNSNDIPVKQQCSIDICRSVNFNLFNVNSSNDNTIVNCTCCIGNQNILTILTSLTAIMLQIIIFSIVLSRTVQLKNNSKTIQYTSALGSEC